ncbi:pseudouridine synthase [Crocinitomicaceae bacterium]|nr:pseudouridine synthase [Crocinitomicaceae bacterium]MDC0098960.1 pseudouridine synthase [Crocinitomicaceae bacterium]MDC1195933.1 pseudouridine synthase [Crocinitomicaceae bacterium]MDC1385346.1 pseudouridine synthase [Crocinitomicaceae bacterium]|tara:strand:+ start:3753 stop:4472 length:720 start_codon:yes stop_codon:yes gene_type:complete
MELIRLNKAIAETGYCSRRAADRLIEDGIVKINGKLAELGTKVSNKDVITVGEEVITKEVRNIYLAFNKPMGIECTTDENIPKNIISYINYPERIYPVGRLDKPSEGLILMTNDGDIVNKILRSRNNHEKEYVVVVDKVITQEFLDGMSNGVPILEQITKKCKVSKVDPRCFNIVLTQGLNRQIRRMTEHFGYEVKKLRRVRIMNIELGDLKKGEYRDLTEKEFTELNELIGDSSKTMD